MINSSRQLERVAYLGADCLDTVERDQNEFSEKDRNSSHTLCRSTLDYTTFINSSCSTRDTVTYLRQSGLMPSNQMIDASKVVITGVQMSKSSKIISMDPPLECSLRNGVKLAQEVGMDLVQKSKQIKNSIGHSSMVIYCEIRDAVSDTLIEVNRKYPCDVPKKAQKNNPHLCEIRGATDNFDMNHKSIKAAKHLYKKCPVLLTLKDFGSASEGIPVLQKMLGYIKRACEKLNLAGHVSGPVQISYNEIWLYLYPPTKRDESPAHIIEHPSSGKFESCTREARRNEFIGASQHDESLLNPFRKDSKKGTAWAAQDEGLRGSTIRYWKLRDGWLPKGKKHFALRSDIELSNFKTKTASSVEKTLYPKEKNTDQAERGIGVLLKRAKMRISDLHDLNETPNNESLLHRVTYNLGNSDAYTIRKVKEDMGLQRFWNTQDKKPPKFSSQFADGLSGHDIQRMHFDSSSGTYS